MCACVPGGGGRGEWCMWFVMCVCVLCVCLCGVCMVCICGVYSVCVCGVCGVFVGCLRCACGV